MMYKKEKFSIFPRIRYIDAISIMLRFLNKNRGRVKKRKRELKVVNSLCGGRHRCAERNCGKFSTEQNS